MNWPHELDGDESGYFFLSAQIAYLYNSQQGVWKHMVSTGSETRSRPSPFPLQSFSVFKIQDKVRDAQFRQQVYYLLSSSFSNVGMAMQV